MSSGASERVRRAIDEIRDGRMVILVDDEDRENEGDLCLAAELVTPEAINFMARFGRGLVCLTLTEEKADSLELPLQTTRRGGPPLGTAFTVSIEARQGVTTGISAADRAHTIRTAVAAGARPEDLITPGHVFPLRARQGGVLVRTGQTEGSVDLARLAGLTPAGVICEIMNDDGTMARMPDLERFAAEHRLTILSIADLIEHRLRQESLVELVASAPMVPRSLGATREYEGRVYRTTVDRVEYLALALGKLEGDVLVRVQVACLAGDVFGLPTCECHAQMRAAVRRIEAEGAGLLVWVFPGGRQSLVDDVAAHVLGRRDPERPARDAKLRDFGLGAQVLADLGVRRMRVLTDHPRKIVGLESYGITVASCVPLGARELALGGPGEQDQHPRQEKP